MDSNLFACSEMRNLQTDSYNAKAIVNRGNVHFYKAEYEKARDMYKEAHTVDVECWEALFNLGIIDYQIRVNLSRLSFSGVTHTFIHFLKYHIGLAYKKLGRFEAALEQFERLRKVMPNSADVFFHIGDLYHPLCHQTLN